MNRSNKPAKLPVTDAERRMMSRLGKRSVYVRRLRLLQLEAKREARKAKP